MTTLALSSLAYTKSGHLYSPLYITNTLVVHTQPRFHERLQSPYQHHYLLYAYGEPPAGWLRSWG